VPTVPICISHRVYTHPSVEQCEPLKHCRQRALLHTKFCNQWQTFADVGLGPILIAASGDGSESAVLSLVMVFHPYKLILQFA